MFASREELQKRLVKPEAGMQWLVKVFPEPEKSHPNFACCGDKNADHSGAEDGEWASAELSRILIKFGHVDDITL